MRGFAIEDTTDDTNVHTANATGCSQPRKRFGGLHEFGETCHARRRCQVAVRPWQESSFGYVRVGYG